MKTIEDLINYGVEEAACIGGLNRAYLAKDFSDLKNWLRGSDWAWLLSKQPRFADYCDWSKLSGYHWAELLEHQPQLAQYKKDVQPCEKMSHEPLAPHEVERGEE